MTLINFKICCQSLVGCLALNWIGTSTLYADETEAFLSPLRVYAIGEDAWGELSVELVNSKVASSIMQQSQKNVVIMRDPIMPDLEKLGNRSEADRKEAEESGSQIHRVTYKEAIFSFRNLDVSGRLSKPRVRFERWQPKPSYSYGKPELDLPNRAFEEAARYQQIIESGLE